MADTTGQEFESLQVHNLFG